jgi:sec-independent protein translocase protein TatC
VDEKKLPLTEHLAELRTRLIRIFIAWAVGAGLTWTWSAKVFALLLAPAIEALGPDGGKLQAIAPTEIFFTYIECALLAGFVIALPVILWQIWAFVAPGLYPNERQMILPFVTVSTLLFAAGAAFGHTAVFPLMFHFFATFDNEFVQSAWTMSEVFSLITHMFIAFGLAFQLPVVIFFLAVAGIVDARTLLAKTPYAVLGIFIAAAILTPGPDWVSQVMLGVPMVVLYLLGVGVAFLVGRRGERASTEVRLDLPKSG